MRSEYNPEEIVALVETLKLLSTEIERNTKIITAGLNHLKGCESGDHRAQISLQVASAISNILVHLRYCGWIEAELTSTRVFAEPEEVLETFVLTQEQLVEEFRKKTEPVPEIAAPGLVQPPPADTADVQSDMMDKAATVPFSTTKQ